jgi:hypothetical protein
MFNRPPFQTPTSTAWDGQEGMPSHPGAQTAAAYRILKCVRARLLVNLAWERRPKHGIDLGERGLVACRAAGGMLVLLKLATPCVR